VHTRWTLRSGIQDRSRASPSTMTWRGRDTSHLSRAHCPFLPSRRASRLQFQGLLISRRLMIVRDSRQQGGVVRKHLRPSGHLDRDLTAQDLADHLLRNCRGAARRVGSRELAAGYQIQVSEARDCAARARVIIEARDDVLCGKPGRGGGWFVANTDTELLSHLARRVQTERTHIENTRRAISAGQRSAIGQVPRTARLLTALERDLKLALGTVQATRVQLLKPTT
jgi:hypothetical protein